MKKSNKEKKYKIKGALTVEATLIFPIILFVMFAIVYLSIIHYQNTSMQAETLRAMNRAGAYWQYLDMDKEGEKTDDFPNAFQSLVEAKNIITSKMIEKRNAYRSLIDLVSEGISKATESPVGSKKNIAKNYVNSRMAGTKLEHHNIEEEVNVNDVQGTGFLFFGDDLKIDITRNHKSPLAIFERNVLNQSNDSGVEKSTENYRNKKIIVSSVISNQTEFIRNVDSVYTIATTLYEMIKAK